MKVGTKLWSSNRDYFGRIKEMFEDGTIDLLKKKSML